MRTPMELLASQEEVYQAYCKAYPDKTFWKSDTGTKYRTVGIHTQGPRSQQVSQVLCYIDYEGNQFASTASGRQSKRCLGNAWQTIDTSIPELTP